MKPKSSEKKVRSYCKVPKSKQEQLINLVYKDEWRINQAAKLLSINYAAAKSIVLRYKKTKMLKKCIDLPESKRCQYRLIGETNTQTNLFNTMGRFVSNWLEDGPKKF